MLSEKDFLAFLEWGAVVFSIAYIYLIIRQKPLGWFFGILASALSIAYFYKINLFSSTLLNLLYLFLGIYGWYHWLQPSGSKVLHDYKLKTHIAIILTGSLISIITGYLATFLPAIKTPYTDAFLAVFSVIATWMETRKRISCWTYWIVINAGYILFYIVIGANGFALLSVLFTVLSVKGFIDWRGISLKQIFAKKN